MVDAILGVMGGLYLDLYHTIVRVVPRCYVLNVKRLRGPVS